VSEHDGYPAILAVTGLLAENKIAKDARWSVACSGANPEALRQMLKEAADSPEAKQLSAVLSFGIAGGLESMLAPGAIVVASSVVSSRATVRTDERLTRAIWDILQIDQTVPTGRPQPELPVLGSRRARRRPRPPSSGPALLRSAIAGVDLPVTSADTKARLRAATRAATVDMESHIAAEFAEALGLPFAAVRVVCDPAGRVLPPELLTVTLPGGGTDVMAVLKAAIRRPALIPDLIRLGGDARRAFAVLRRVGAVLGRNLYN
jgi:hypothetical protein